MYIFIYIHIYIYTDAYSGGVKGVIPPPGALRGGYYPPLSFSPKWNSAYPKALGKAIILIVHRHIYGILNIRAKSYLFSFLASQFLILRELFQVAE